MLLDTWPYNVGRHVPAVPGPAGLWVAGQWSGVKAWDSSVKANHGTLAGGVTLIHDAPDGLWGSWGFDGSTGYIAGTGSNLSASSSLTVAFSPNSVTGQHTIFGYFDGAHLGSCFTIETNGTSLVCNVRIGSNNYSTGVTTLAVGEQYLAELIVERDGSGNFWRTVYLNGKEESARTYSGNAAMPSLPYFCIGRNYAWTSFQQFFNGSVALANRYSTLHTAAEVAALYQQSRVRQSSPAARLRQRLLGATAAAGGKTPWHLFGRVA